MTVNEARVAYGLSPLMMARIVHFEMPYLATADDGYLPHVHIEGPVDCQLFTFIVDAQSRDEAVEQFRTFERSQRVRLQKHLDDPNDHHEAAGWVGQ